MHLDDDITVEPDGIEVFLKDWNKEKVRDGKPLGGMSFNVVDAVKPTSNIIRSFMFAQAAPGFVNASGYSSAYAPTDHSFETNWLLGGSTGWCRSVIDAFPHPINFPTRWAVCEDVIFSYGINRAYRLMVTHGAKVRHNETYESLSIRKAVFYGKSQVIMRHFFVRMYDDLSMLKFFWMSFSQSVGYVLMGVLGKKRYFGFGLGGIIGLAACLSTGLRFDEARGLAKKLYG